MTIPGMTGAVAMTGELVPIPLSSVSVFATTTADESATIAWPTGHRRGDLALLYDVCWIENSGADPASVVPSGFGAIINQTGRSGEIGGRTRIVLSYRILDGTEPSDGFITGMSGNRREPKILLLIRGNVGIRTVTAHHQNTYFPEIGSSNPPLQTVNVSGGTLPILIYAFHAKQTDAIFTAQNPAFLGTVAASATRAIGGYRPYSADGTPVNQEVDAQSGTGSDIYGVNLISGYLELA